MIQPSQLLMALLAISKGMSLAVCSNSHSESGKTRRWKTAIEDITRNHPRLAEFSEAVWNVHNNLQKPSHQHLINHPSQRCDAPFPGLVPVQPLHPNSAFPWSTQLESNWRGAKEEVEKYLETTREHPLSWKTSTTQLCDNTNGFTKLTLQDHEGNPTALGQKHFPKTLALLQQQVVDLAPRPVNINCQAPKSGLAPHSDNMNFLLTCHLGLRIPQEGECIFRIASAPDYPWAEGKVVIADTSFVHSTVNTSPRESRYVLSFCIWHPDLSQEERKGIVAIHSLLQQMD